MLSTLAAVLLLSGVPAQDPAKPDPTKQPPTKQDVTKAQNNPALDDLRLTVQDFAKANSYKFKVETVVRPALFTRATTESGTQPKGVVYAKEGQDEVKMDIKGEFQNGMPVHLDGKDVEAFRQGSKIIYRAGDKVWRVKDTGASLPTGTAGTSLPVDSGKPEDVRERENVLWALCALPVPHELLRDLDANVTNLTRMVDEKLLTKDKLVYEGQLKGECLKNCGKEFGNATDVACSIRITTSKDRKIEKIELNANHGKSNPSATTPTPADKSSSVDSKHSDVCFVYEIDDINDAEVKVPEEVQKLLANK